MVSLVPLGLGNLLATRSVAPGFARWTMSWAGGAESGASSSEFWRLCRETLGEARPLCLAVLVWGPLGWAAALAINDVHDLAGDRTNPRKQGSPLVSGALSLTFARDAAYGFATAALLVAAAVGIGFLVITAAFLILAWCYSVPPARLKSRAGADVLVNAAGVGALPLLAGWTITRPVVSFPWIMLAQGMAVTVALYVPTTLVDHDTDAAAGYKTCSTRLGYRRAYRVGLLAWTSACVGAVVLAGVNVVIPRPMLPVLIVAAPVLVCAYHFFIGRACGSMQGVRGIIVVSWMFLVPNVMFALMYAGVRLPQR
jgi:chlorophyll synthase